MHTPLHANRPAPRLIEALLDLAVAARREGAPLALAGPQGSGKSTLAMRLVDAAAARGLRAVSLSIDDVYLDRAERERLSREVHPLLVTRGPPGTHDVALACDVIDRLVAGHAVALPRFDKLGDARLPESHWPRVHGCDVLLVEGWCLRVPAQDAEALRDPVNALERDEDVGGGWRRWCNDALARDYPALWARLPRLVVLQPPSFDVVPLWRWQQECALHAAESARVAMSRSAVERFVQHFERVGRHALSTLPARADHVLHLDAERRVDPHDLAAIDNRRSPTGSAA